ncbi:hypothetical protein F2Q68_00026740 [Brassica cretica]|uniref:Uncharacterized protein n=1 Tax=Brassica cretica TaxID=69181 RepID=A0A8S9I9V3_BRACR|nr:hypothetical protein F2Q68_00026740 [Brassica cretica]
MQNLWQLPGGVSALNPPSLTPGEDPPKPPDPPDPASPFSPSQYPPLFSPPVKSTVPSKHSVSLLKPVAKDTTLSSVTIESGKNQKSSNWSTSSAGLPPLEVTGSENSFKKTFTILKPSHNSPLQTNRASNSSSYTPSSTKLLTSQPDSTPQFVPTIVSPPSQQNPSVTNTIHETLTQNQQEPPPQPPVNPIPGNPTPNPTPRHIPPVNPTPRPAPTLVEKIRRSEDKTLQRLAPITIAASGRPRVLIPDSVFKTGEEMHKDFIGSKKVPF